MFCLFSTYEGSEQNDVHAVEKDELYLFKIVLKNLVKIQIIAKKSSNASSQLSLLVLPRCHAITKQIAFLHANCNPTAYVPSDIDDPALTRLCLMTFPTIEKIHVGLVDFSV